MALEPVVEQEDERLIRLGLRALVDGGGQARLRDMLLETAEAETQPLHHAAGLFEAAGGYAPTMGVLGAVLGLIHALQQLDDPQAMGPGVATAASWRPSTDLLWRTSSFYPLPDGFALGPMPGGKSSLGLAGCACGRALGASRPVERTLRGRSMKSRGPRGELRTGSLAALLRGPAHPSFCLHVGALRVHGIQ